MRRFFLFFSVVALLLTCSKKTEKVYDNPVDPVSYRYVGRESVDEDGDGKGSYVDPDDPHNLPVVDSPLLGMVRVPAGNFTMGSNGGNSDEQPLHTVYLDTFWIDQYEVTNAQYQAFVQATGRAQPGCSGNSDFNGSQQPVVCVSWFDAEAYCQWSGKRLPTEAEWEKAARGTDGWTYPWGNQEANCTYAVMYDNDTNGCGRNTTWLVGSKPAGVSPYGAHDLAGNVWEWVEDWYDGAYYSSMSTWRNPKGPATGDYRVLRGGSWYDFPYFLRASYRYRFVPVYSSSNIGFRCAR